MFELGALVLSSSLAMNQLVLPSGFSIEVYARVKNARQMTLGDKGTVFVGTRSSEGRVYALVDKDNDGKIDQRYLVTSGLQLPSGVAFRDGHLYVGAINRILRYKNIENHLARPPEPEVVIDDLPDETHHGWKVLEFSPRGTLFIPVGVPCNICKPDDIYFGTILELDLLSSKYRIFAQGVRNSVGMAFHPVDHSLWFSDNGRDWLGDDLPPDEINRAKDAGMNFGFPYVYGNNQRDPKYAEVTVTNNFTPPVVELGAHVAPLGLTFYTGKQFPDQYRYSLFVAEHGSWNRTRKAGYRVMEIRFNGDRVSQVKPFISGWLDTSSDRAWGRPVDVLQMPDGALLVSDDYAGVIYRVSYSSATP